MRSNWARAKTEHTRRCKAMFGVVNLVQPKAQTLLAVAFLMSGAMASGQSLTITTLAGQVGATGSADGTGASARFSSRISDMVVDPAGNLYLLDANNCTIRKVTAAGVVTTIAGAAAVKEYRDGTSSGAHFYSPGGLARDSAGNLYVGDWNPAGGGATVRKITPAGVVTSYLPSVLGVALAMDVNDYLLVGGQPMRAFLAGMIVEIGPWWVPPAGAPPPPPVGNFGTMTALTVGHDRTIYVVDMVDQEVRKITTAGVMTSLAGAAGMPGYADGTGVNARFNLPDGIAVDSAGNVYVADGNNPVLRKITPGGVVTTVAGLVGAPPGDPYPDGVGSNARFIHLSALATGSDDVVYIADFGAIRKATVAAAPAKIVVSPEDVIVAAGERATFSVAANGYPAASYQWQRLSASGGNWINLSDSATYAGTTSAVLVVNVAAGSMNGDRFRCVVSNTLATDTSAVATLTVDPPIVVVPLRVTTLAGKASASGSSRPQSTSHRGTSSPEA